MLNAEDIRRLGGGANACPEGYTWVNDYYLSGVRCTGWLRDDLAKQLEPARAKGDNNLLPLHVECDGEECYVTATNALERLCTMSRPSAVQRLADARRIVRACNAHADLVQALREIAGLSVPQATATKEVWVAHGQEWIAAIEQARAAIAKAEGHS